jgi:hypothetical protein
VLNDAITSIRGANEEARRRRRAQIARRRPIRLLDHWLGQVEGLIERDQPFVPIPLVREIAAYLGRLDLNPVLYRKLSRRRESMWVLDVLFEAEEDLLPGA